MGTELDRLNDAVSEANRFLEKAYALEAIISQPGYHHQLVERSAARRASLDLTRALAQFRKGDFD